MADLLGATLEITNPQKKHRQIEEAVRRRSSSRQHQQEGVIALTLEAFVGRRQVLSRVRVHALGADEGSHRLGVHRGAHHPPVAHDPPHDVGVHRGVDKRRVKAGREVAPSDGADGAGPAAEDPWKS